MYQLTFSKQSSSVLDKLNRSVQMRLIDFLSGLNFGKDSLLEFGQIVREKTTYYRVRWEQLRIYLECVGEQSLVVHYLLPRHTWNDFLFRAKLPFNEEKIEKDNTFWEFLEHLEK